MPDTIRVEVDGPIAVLTLARPDRLNAYTTRMGVELFSTMHALDMDDAVRAIIVTGEGRAFCAGADLAAGGATFAGERTWDEAREAEAKVQPWNMRTPVIGAINGPAVGIGATMPLLWDLRIASDRARIGFVFTRRGITPEHHSTWILPRLVGQARAIELLLLGRILSAPEALAAGLVHEVVPHDELMARARAIATDIARSTAPMSVALVKRLLWRQLLDDDPVRAKAREDALFEWIGKQPDAAEGVRAFLEKRDPRWTMRPSTDLPDDLLE